LRYLQSGYSVHLRGPAGTGKTTLALHLADLLSRPIMMVFGDDEFKTSDLIGNQSGYTRKKVVDNYIHSVVKVEDEVRHNWVDSRLTLACREGFTLVYDEFNRSRPEVNNVLLSALEEKLLVLPPSGNRPEYLRVDQHFRAIFTSNPEEYAGEHGTQDALLDRLITIHMPEPDELTQQQILIQKVGIEPADALLIVRLVKAFQSQLASNGTTSLRPCLMIANICHEHGVPVMTEDADFRDVCSDVLLSRVTEDLSTATRALWDLFNGLMVGVALSETDVLEPKPPKTPIPDENPEPVSKAKGKGGHQPATQQSTEPAQTQPQPEAARVAETVLNDVETQTLAFLTQKTAARLSEIESELSLSRFKAVDALRSLVELGYVQKHNKPGKPTIYRLSAD
ncbi:MAG: gas vesicle protein GvpN, partial [Leptolyngbyaceae cyanobacterium]